MLRSCGPAEPDSKVLFQLLVSAFWGLSLEAVTPIRRPSLQVRILVLTARGQCLAALTSRLKITLPFPEMPGALELFPPLLPPERSDLIVCPMKLQEQSESFQSNS